MYLQVATYQNHNMEFNFIHLTNERMKASTNIKLVTDLNSQFSTTKDTGS